jgi:hypothetical protein
VAHPQTDHSYGIELGLGVLAAALAVTGCVAAINLVNRPTIAAAIGLPEWGVFLVTAGAIATIVMVVVSVLVGVIPLGALRWERGYGVATFDVNRVGSH